MRPEKLEAWRALLERYGNRDESRVDRGTLLGPAARVQPTPSWSRLVRGAERP